MDDERKLGHGDREMLRQAAAGEGIPLTPELWEELTQAAGERKAEADEMFADLTPEQAKYVRHLRVDEGYSWRAVAETCYVEWSGEWGPPSNQIVGMALCEHAAKQFGEAYMKAPWNGQL